MRENWTNYQLLPEILTGIVLRGRLGPARLPGCSYDEAKDRRSLIINHRRSRDCRGLEKEVQSLAWDDLVVLVEFVFEVPAANEGEEEPAKYADVGCCHVVGEGGMQ